jgi:hypothetical protein
MMLHCQTATSARGLQGNSVGADLPGISESGGGSRLNAIPRHGRILQEFLLIAQE